MDVNQIKNNNPTPMEYNRNELLSLLSVILFFEKYKEDKKKRDIDKFFSVLFVNNRAAAGGPNQFK